MRLTSEAVAAYLAALLVLDDPRPVLAPLTALLVVQVTLVGTVADSLRRILSVIAGKGPDDYVFAAEKGAVLHLRNFRRKSFGPAVHATGLDGLTPHALRHTAASLAIAVGANVKVVQTMLGHKSATMTLDLYGHLMTDRLDQVADAMDAARRSFQDHADSLRTKPIVRDLDEARQRARGQ